jgi:2-oxoacid:acceptor oxidoreductase delta subunit (pyruvate/2-ketoisovalerate family)
MTATFPRPSPVGLVAGPATSADEHTGAWRTARPVYVDLAAPCAEACPAGEDVRGWLYRVQGTGEEYEQAWRLLTARNPLPAVMGRVCYRRCEDSCLRRRLDGAVAIGSVERFLGDEAIRRGWALDPSAADTGRRVLVVGAGPAGLSAAHQLRRAGHAVTIHEALDRPGGMMRTAISAQRLPHPVLDAEIDRLLATGIALKVGRATRLTGELEEYDAVVHCGGAAVALALVAGTILWRQPRHAAGGTRPDRTVTYAIGQGRQAAEAVNAHLAGERPAEPVPARVATEDRLNTWYYSPARSQAAGSPDTLNGAQALFEARRCLTCGSCFECDNCYGLCPDDAIVKHGVDGRYTIDLDYCKGCGICAHECPSGAIEMVPELR